MGYQIPNESFSLIIHVEGSEEAQKIKNVPSWFREGANHSSQSGSRTVIGTPYNYRGFPIIETQDWRYNQWNSSPSGGSMTYTWHVIVPQTVYDTWKQEYFVWAQENRLHNPSFGRSVVDSLWRNAIRKNDASICIRESYDAVFEKHSPKQREEERQEDERVLKRLTRRSY